MVVVVIYVFCLLVRNPSQACLIRFWPVLLYQSILTLSISTQKIVSFKIYKNRETLRQFIKLINFKINSLSKMQLTRNFYVEHHISRTSHQQNITSAEHQERPIKKFKKHIDAVDCLPSPLQVLMRCNGLKDQETV